VSVSVTWLLLLLLLLLLLVMGVIWKLVVEMVVVCVQVVVEVVVDVEGGVLVEVLSWKLISRAEQLIDDVLHDWPANNHNANFTDWQALALLHSLTKQNSHFQLRNIILLFYYSEHSALLARQIIMRLDLQPP